MAWPGDRALGRFRLLLKRGLFAANGRSACGDSVLIAVTPDLKSLQAIKWRALTDGRVSGCLASTRPGQSSDSRNDEPRQRAGFVVTARANYILG